MIGSTLHDYNNDWSNQEKLFDMTEYYDRQIGILEKSKEICNFE
nr:MAG TPA: hypothetical protein [Inoviridae sp.]